MSVHAITLPIDGQEERRKLEVSPMDAFKPCGLLLWGVSPGAIVHQVRSVGHDLLVGPVPAIMFLSNVGWEFFRGACVKSPHHGYPAVDTRELGHFFRFDLSAAAIGQIIAVDLEGRADHAVLLGRMLPVSLPMPEPGVASRRFAGQQQ